MSNSRDLIQAIVDEDFVSAKEMTNNLIFGTVSDELDQVRRDVAEDLFDVCEECDQEEMSPMQAARTKNKGMYR